MLLSKCLRCRASSNMLNCISRSPDCLFLQDLTCKLIISFCMQCFCYVCDKPQAECPRWGSGLHEGDHCNAYETDSWHRKRAAARSGARVWPSIPPRVPVQVIQMGNGFVRRAPVSNQRPSSATRQNSASAPGTSASARPNQAAGPSNRTVPEPQTATQDPHLDAE
jgi:hypothetical protein